VYVVLKRKGNFVVQRYMLCCSSCTRNASFVGKKVSGHGSLSSIGSRTAELQRVEKA
jgi:hypothetical protein